MDKQLIAQHLYHALTAYDMRLERKQSNPYRLGHFLAAVDEFKASTHTDTLAALQDSFIYLADKQRFDLPPVNRVAKKLGII